MAIGRACMVNDTNQDDCSLLTFIRIIPLAYAILLLILAIYKGAEYWRMSAGLKGFMLVKVVIRDQILYFML